MKLLSLSVRNFRLLADVDITFPSDGIVGIIGSNEVGKSTLTEAATWALYGAAAIRGTMEGLRWKGAPAKRTAAVTLTFELDGKLYGLERGEHSARLEEAGVVVAEGVEPVNTFVPKLLGMSLKEFSASILCRQRDLNRMASMKPAERQALVRRVLGVGRVDDALKAVRAECGVLGDQIAGLEMGLGERGPLEDGLARMVAMAAEAGANAEQAHGVLRTAEAAQQGTAAALAQSVERKGVYDGLVAQRKERETAMAAASIAISRLSSLLESQRQAWARVTAGVTRLVELPGLRAERDDLVAARAAVSEFVTLDKQLAAQRYAADALDKRIATSMEERAFVPSWVPVARRAAEDASRRLTELNTGRLTRRAEQMAEADRYEKDGARHRRREQDIYDAGADGACPTCARKLGDALASVLAGLAEDVATARNEADLAKGRAILLAVPSDEEKEALQHRDAAEKVLELLRERETAAKQATKDIAFMRGEATRIGAEMIVALQRRDALPQVEYNADRLTAVDAEIAALEKLDRSLVGDRGLAATMDDTVAQIGEQEEAEGDISLQLDMLMDALAQHAFDPADHAALAQEALTATAAHQNARVALAMTEATLAGSQQAVRGAEGTLVFYDERALHLAEKRARHLTYEQTAMRLAEFRIAVASTIRPELEELASGFVHLLTDGRHEAVTIDEEFGMTLYEGGIPVETVSGGTEDVAALAMRLALSQLITQRSGHDLGLLVLDEIFGSLDEARRGNVLGLLRRLRGVFPQIVLISHVAETRDLVDHAIELVHDEEAGCTRVRGGGAPPAANAA